MAKLDTALSSTKPISTARIFASVGFVYVALGFLYFGIAGTFQWPAAWICLATQFLFGLYTGLWLKKHDPALLKERMNVARKSGEIWDKRIMKAYGALSFIGAVISALDVARFHWSYVSSIVQVAAFIALVFGELLVLRVMRENTFLTPIVEIQRHRHHEIISTGPYAYVRHPMYSGLFAAFVAIPLLLGSLWGAGVGLLTVVLFLYRIKREEQTLSRELIGYADYLQRVRYRVIPGVW